MSGHPRLLVGNEFALVSVSIDDSGNDPRLLVCDERSGGCVAIDALVLASIVGATADDLRALVDPARLLP